MKFLKAIVLLTNGTDEVILSTDYPCSFCKEALPSQPNLQLSFHATKDTGAEYVRKNFDIEPEIIDIR